MTILIGELQGSTMEPAETPRQLEAATQLLRMLKDAGITSGAFNASELFDLKTPVIQHSARVLYEKLEPLVGSVTQPETVKLTPTRSLEYQTGSSQYVSATSEAESDSPADLQRMTLGPSGEEMLRGPQANNKPDRSSHEPTPMVAPIVTSTRPEQMQTFFNAVMSRYLKEIQTEGLTPMAGRHTTTNQDVEMESVESHHGSHGEYDPDNLSVDTSRQAVIASAGAASAPSMTMPRIRVSAISELKEYSGKDHDEDRARSWLATRREHVDHFIETLDDRGLADQLALLRLTDAEDLEETLRARQRAKARQGKTHAGLNKTESGAQTYVSVLEECGSSTSDPRGDSSESESDVNTSDQEDECRRVYLSEAKDRENHSITTTHRDGAADHPTMSQKNCTYCGSTKHDNLGCWKRLTCQKCGRKGHPSDHCLFVCRACGEVHKPGNCPMEEFYNFIRQWHVPNKHAGMMPANAEKMLN
ncbi:hypothetical protein PHMEG_00032608, partial [Phytophthora megakarya]